MNKLAMDARLQQLYFDMLEFFSGDSRRCQHWVKVHSFARMIGLSEQLDEHTQLVLEATAILHDCGIKPGEVKYGVGHAHGHVQEVEGPPEAEKLLRKAGFSEEDIARACYLVAHHHTYDSIDGLDYQILVEADFLVNLHEYGLDKETVSKNVDNIFQTATGKIFAQKMFGL